MLGVNTLVMAAPAVLAYLLFSPLMKTSKIPLVSAGGFLAGVTGIIFGALLVALALISTGESFRNVAMVIIIAHIPVMIIEGVVTAFCVLFLKRVKPEILEVGK